MFIHRSRIIVVLFFLASVGLLVQPVEAAKLTRLDGTVYAIDTTAKTVTLKDAGDVLNTLNITRSSKITRNNKKATLADLVLGDQASVQFDVLRNAKQVAAKGPKVTTVRGGVLNVSGGTGVVQITTGNFGTNAQTRVLRNGKVSSLKSLTAHDTLKAHLAARGAPAPTVVAGSGDALDVIAEGPEESELHGTVAVVDTTAGTVTITPKEGGSDVTVNVTADTLIEVCDGAATINDLASGLFVELVYDPLTLNAFRIDAECEGEEAEIEGVITAIDPTAGTVTITNGDGVAITLLVDASTKIERNDVPALLSDLLVGDEASAEYNSVTMVANEIEAGVEPEEPPDPETEPVPEPAHD
jgi:Cu/Ag efflux protein CusF